MSFLARSPPPQTIRPMYFVQSPPNTDVDKISTGSGCSPFRSPVNHSESMAESYSTPRSSVPLRYTSLQVHDHDDHDEDCDDMDGLDERRGSKKRLFYCLLFMFVLAFTIFCLILWGVSKSFSPIVTLKGIVIESLSVQSGNDESGVVTDMLTLNSTVTILYQNPSTFFTVHVSSSFIHLSYTKLILASGQMENFSQRRKSGRNIEINVLGNQVPLYGGVPALYAQRAKPDQVVLPLNLTFTLRSRAYVLGHLVKTTFYTDTRCSFSFHGDELGKTLDLSKSCL